MDIWSMLSDDLQFRKFQQQLFLPEIVEIYGSLDIPVCSFHRDDDSFTKPGMANPHPGFYIRYLYIWSCRRMYRLFQSGERTGQGLSITRRGDSYMRSLLYLAARAAVSQKAPGIVDYFNRKLSGTKESGAHPRRSAVIATAVKMLGVVHALASDSGAKYDPKRVTGIISHK